jgi:hypothetical protein
MARLVFGIKYTLGYLEFWIRTHKQLTLVCTLWADVPRSSTAAIEAWLGHVPGVVCRSGSYPLISAPKFEL